MSAGEFCKHCRHYKDHHEAGGKCRIYELNHGGRDMKESCRCPGYEIEPSSRSSRAIEQHFAQLEDLLSYRARNGTTLK